MNIMVVTVKLWLIKAIKEKKKTKKQKTRQDKEKLVEIWEY